MHNNQNNLISDLFDEDASLAESNLQQHMLRAVKRRKQVRRLGRGSMALAIGVFAVLIYLTQPTNDGISIERAANSTAPESTPARFTVVSNAPHLDYVGASPRIDYVPTRSIGVTLVTDAELESTFSDQSYAFYRDDERQIRSFQLLDVLLEN
ncbi:MAG: hypothetical protein GKR91_09265 [Pseudomonadales bacterium]|nr:hypothetical protein [Pseudomonadales bacterium]